MKKLFDKVQVKIKGEKTSLNFLNFLKQFYFRKSQDYVSNFKLEEKTI